MKYSKIMIKTSLIFFVESAMKSSISLVENMPFNFDIVPVPVVVNEF
jgi:hypothetical protein